MSLSSNNVGYQIYKIKHRTSPTAVYKIFLWCVGGKMLLCLLRTLFSALVDLNHVDLRTAAVYSSSQVTQEAKSCSLPGRENSFCGDEHPTQGCEQALQEILPLLHERRDRKKMWKIMILWLMSIFRNDWELHSRFLPSCWTPSKTDFHTSSKHTEEQFSQTAFQA